MMRQRTKVISGMSSMEPPGQIGMLLSISLAIFAEIG